MPKLFHRRNRYLIAALVALTSLGGYGAAASGRAQLLSGDALKSLIPGAILQHDTPIGTVVPVSYGKDGTLAGRAGAVAFFLGSATDRGRWWVAGSKLCHKWTVWFEAKRHCIVLRRSGRKIVWDDGKGETGTATLIAYRPAKRTRVASSKSARIAAARVVRKPAVKRRPIRTVRASTRPIAPKRGTAKPRATMPKARKVIVRTPRVPPVRAVVKTTRRQLLGPTYRVVGMRGDDVLNVRSAPTAEAPVVTTLPQGAGRIQIVGACSGYWCPIKYARHTGWVNRAFLGSNRLARDASRSPTYRVVRVRGDDVLNIRRAPLATAPVVAFIPAAAGDVRVTHGCIEDWCRIVYLGRVGWVARAYLTPDRRSLARLR